MVGGGGHGEVGGHDGSCEVLYGLMLFLSRRERIK